MAATKSQAWAVPSWPPSRRVRPSRLKATAVTGPGCGNGRPMGCPVATSHRRDD